tara:strand:+ start:1892 stop:2152 length:261 start_codon:yes stop_codon:yes gene_type:complete
MKLSKEQLKNVQDLQTEFSNQKIMLGDLVYKQSLVIKKIDELKEQFVTMEAALIKEFGQDSVIDLKTGEVKPKEDSNKENEQIKKV